MKDNTTWGKVKYLMYKYVMIVSALWGMCRKVMLKYDFTHTSHINHLYPLNSMINFRLINNKMDNRLNNTRRNSFTLFFRGFNTRSLISIKGRMVGERHGGELGG